MDTKRIIKRFTAGHFRDWLRTIADRNQSFDYVDNENCMVAAYLKAQGSVAPSVGAAYFWFGQRDYPIPAAIVDAFDRVFEQSERKTTLTPREVLKALGRHKNL